MKSKLLETLQRINDNYGRGRIRKLCRKTNTAIVHYGWGIDLKEKVKFRVLGNKVTFRGQTRTIGFKAR
jgi:hypothetical protein